MTSAARGSRRTPSQPHKPRERLPTRYHEPALTDSSVPLCLCGESSPCLCVSVAHHPRVSVPLWRLTNPSTPCLCASVASHLRVPVPLCLCGESAPCLRASVASYRTTVFTCWSMSSAAFSTFEFASYARCPRIMFTISSTTLTFESSTKP